ncbi:MAG: efflux transporter outer membrane subunit [Phycisphaerae bacterium]|nr:efflux transporter outer membrane subunit [Phycisphaerae bacterium]
MIRHLVMFTSGIIVFAGCAVGPNFRPPRPAVPQAWVGAGRLSTSQPSVATSQPASLARWWDTLGDPKLTALVEEAIQSNLDVQLATARIRQARGQRGIAVGGLLPSANASAAYSRQHPAGALAIDQNLYQTGLDAAWEIDVFGGLRRGVESAAAEIIAAVEALRDVQVTLVAEVALTYVQLRGLQEQIRIARDNVQGQRRTAEITRQRRKAGFVSDLDVANADAQVATTESQIPVLDAAARQTIYTLSVLLAKSPGDLVDSLSPGGPLPAAPADVPVGLPSDLLRRRPDIRQAEAQLHSATAQIGVATADLFPKFSLTGSIDWRAAQSQDLFKSISRSWSFGPSMTWAIFQGGAVVSNIKVQEALRDQAMINYRKIVLTALQDTENALIAFAREQEHRRILADAVTFNRRAEKLSMDLYQQGQTDFINVLNAQRSRYAAEDALIQSERSVTTDLIALYKALGGGWEPATPAAPTTAPDAAGK